MKYRIPSLAMRASKVRLFLQGMLLIFLVWGSAPAGATVWSGDINDLNSNTPFSFGDGINNLNVQWFYPGSGVGVIPGFGNVNTLYPGTSDVWVDVLDSPIDIGTFDAEPGSWHDLHDTFAGSDRWVAFKGLNGYYGVWHIYNYAGPPFAGMPGTLNGRWYFQDDGSSYFGNTAVPLPGAIWLLGSGLLAMAGLRKRKT